MSADAERSFPVGLEVVNGWDAAAFVAHFGDVAEHSPWVAARAMAARPYADVAQMVAAFAAAVDAAEPEAQRGLLRAHPDLAGRAAIAGEMAPESVTEQKGAGLDRLTPAEFARFQDLNDRYRARFGHPFILAVKGATKDVILAAFARRIDNDPATEFATALEQVKRIVGFRLEDRVRP